MDNRKWEADAIVSPPTAPVSPSDGYPTNGDPLSAQNATEPGAWWFHAIGEELRNVIEAAGLTPDHTLLTQLLDALRSVGVFQTPTQFDSSTKASTTAFVKNSGIQTSNFVSYSVAAVIPASSCGKAIQLAPATAQTFTLPLTTDCPNGSILMFKNTGVGAALLSRAGGDVITQGSGAGVTLQIGSGDDVILISNGGGSWFSFSGSAQLEFTSEFLASRAASGYQKLPGGLIIQWGNASVTAGTLTTATLPIAFPNQIFNAGGSVNQTNATANIYANINPFSLSQVRLSISSSGPINVNYFAIGN